MMKTIKFTMYENGALFDSAEVETHTELSELMKSLEKFQQIVNTAITAKIEEGDIDDCIEDDFDSSEEAQEPAPHAISPKKRKL